MSRSSAAPVSITTSSYLEAMVAICLANASPYSGVESSRGSLRGERVLRPEAGTSLPVGVNEQRSLSHATLLGEQRDDHSVP